MRPNRRLQGSGLLLATLVSTACAPGGAKSPTAPDPPGPPTSVLTWVGSVRATITREGPTSSTAESFEGSLTWRKVANPGPDVAPAQPGTVLYEVSSGSLRVTYKATRTNTNAGVQCFDEAAVDVPMPAAHDPQGTRPGIYLDADGQYRGSIGMPSGLPMNITFTCSHGASGSFRGEMRSLWLDVKGAATADRRLQGEMAPQATGVGETTAGSWDFAAR